MQCDLCPRDCRLHEGQRGLCFVRMRGEGEQMLLTTYGRSSASASTRSRKNRSTISIRDRACCRSAPPAATSPASSARTGTFPSRAISTGWPTQAQCGDNRQPRIELGCKSVAFTYNDPVIFAEYAMDVADACHAVGVQTVAVTAGYMHAAPRREFYAKMDAANVDLKAFTEEFYFKLTGAHLQPVLDTLVYLRHETQVGSEITTLLIPGQERQRCRTQALSRWMLRNSGPEVPLHFSAFHPDWKMMDIPGTPPRPRRRARRIALRHGLHYVYTGNVHDTEGGTTFCPHCGNALIVRDWYNLLNYRVTEDGHCRECGGAIAGRFRNSPRRSARAACR